MGDLTVDWESVHSGQLTDAVSGTRTLTLAAVIENISRDLESDAGDESYGVGTVVKPLVSQEKSQSAREFMVAVLAQLAASLASKPLGL